MDFHISVYYQVICFSLSVLTQLEKKKQRKGQIEPILFTRS